MAYVDLGNYGYNIILDDKEFSKGLKNSEKSMGNFNSKMKSWSIGIGKIATGAILGLTTAVLGAGLAGTKMADDLQKSLNGLQASTGATDSEIKEMEKSLENIYNNNFGESFEDIADSMALVKQETQASGEELEKMTQNALMMRDTFDLDVSESIRTVDSLMKQFGITSDEAYTLMAQGIQNGLNQNGDMLDVLNEYAPQFKALGYSSEKMFDTLISGAESGAFSIDKVGDAIKEFNIRSKDMSDSSRKAFNDLGFNADEMFKKFAKGGDDAQKATQDVFKALGNLDDPLKQNAIGVQLFGTQFEDLEASTILALGNVESKVNSTANTLEVINNVKYNSFGEAMTGIGRNLQTALIQPLQEHVLPLLSQFSQWINSHMPQIKTTISTTFDIIGSIIKTTITIFKNLQNNLNDTDSTTSAVFNSIKSIISSVINTIKAIINEFITTFNIIWKKCGDGITKYAKSLWENISNIISGILEVIRGVIQTVLSLIRGDWEGAWNGIKLIIDGILQAITSAIEQFINGIQAFLSASGEVLKNIGSTMFNMLWEGMKSIWNEISDWISDKVNWLKDKLIFWKKSQDEMSSSNNSSSNNDSSYSLKGIPQYSQGTPWVPNTGLALLHKGEMVVPAEFNPYVKSNNSTTSNTSNNTIHLIPNFNITLNSKAKYTKAELRELAKDLSGYMLDETTRKLNIHGNFAIIK